MGLIGYILARVRHLMMGVTTYIYSKNRPLGRFFHRVAMSMYIYVPFPCNYFRGPLLALRPHDHIPASHLPSGHTTLLLALPAERVRQVLWLQVGSSERKVQVVFVMSSVIPSN